MMPATITVDQAGRVLGLAKSTAYDAVYRGDIPSLRIGRRIMVPVHELLRMLGIDPDSAHAREVIQRTTPRAPALRLAKGSAA